MGISKGHVSADEVRAKLQAVVAQFSVPCEVLLAPQDDSFRKPRLGSWQYLLQTNGDLAPVLAGNFIRRL